MSCENDVYSLNKSKLGKYNDKEIYFIVMEFL